MDYCEQIWTQHDNIQITAQDRNHCSGILLQASFSLIRILQAIRFIQFGLLFKLHFLLDFSWDELRTMICSLRSLTVCEEEERGFIRNVSVVALDPILFPVPFDLIMRDLACGYLRVMQRILRGEVDKNFK
jgi:hypothetical protein